MEFLHIDSIDIEKQDFSSVQDNFSDSKLSEDGSLLLTNNGYNFRIFPGSEGMRMFFDYLFSL
jgi:hypothetical protein